MLIVSLSFSESVPSNYLSLNNEPYMVISTLIDFNSVELKYYQFMISLDKCNGSCYVLSPKICVTKN